MAWQSNVTMTTKQNPKASMYVEYSNLMKELKEYMPEFNVSIKDLQEPSQSFVTGFYTEVLGEFFCDVNNLTEIQVTQNLTYPEMYGEIVPILNLCTALRYIYSKLGIDDFGLNDICDPSPKRTYRLLQTMVNFIKYSDEKIYQADTKMKAVRSIKGRIDVLKKEKDIFVNKINQKFLDRKQRDSEINVLSDEIKVNKVELMKISQLKDENHHEVDKLKQEQFEIEKTYLKLSELRDNILKDITTLRGQIVEAPDLLKADHERYKRMKNDAAEKKSAMMAQVTVKKQIVITLEQELAAQEKRFNLLIDVTEKNNKMRKLVQEIETLSQKKSEMLELEENLKEKIEVMERARADINNKVNYLMKEMEQERNTFKSNYDLLLKAKNNLYNEKTQHFEIIKVLENDMNKNISQKNEIEAEVANIMYSFEKERSVLKQLRAELMKQISDFNPTKN